MNTNTLDINQYLNFIQEVDYDKILAEQEYLIEGVNKDDIDKISKKFNLIKKISAKYGIYEKEIKKMVSSAEEKVMDLYESGVQPKEAGEKLSSLLKKEIVKKIKSVHTKYKYGQLRADEKILIAIAGFIIVFAVNIMILKLLAASSLSQIKAIYIASVILGPIIEESLKTYFIAKKMPWVGTTVAFGIEAVQNAFMAIQMGGNIAKVIILRTAALLMHLTTTFIQKKIIDNYDDDSKAIFIAWLSGTVVHMTWNLATLLNAEKIATWAGMGAF